MTHTIAPGRFTARSEAERELQAGQRIASLLNERSEALPHDIQERLRFAREQALAKALRPTAELQLAHSAGVYKSGTSLVIGGRPAWLTWLGSALPLALLMGGLVVIDEWHDRAQIYAVAEVDADLLNDELPPLAYSDPGFAEFLRVSHD
jgi:hypothetical protein